MKKVMEYCYEPEMEEVFKDSFIYKKMNNYIKCVFSVSAFSFKLSFLRFILSFFNCYEGH